MKIGSCGNDEFRLSARYTSWVFLYGAGCDEYCGKKKEKSKTADHGYSLIEICWNPNANAYNVTMKKSIIAIALITILPAIVLCQETQTETTAQEAPKKVLTIHGELK